MKKVQYCALGCQEGRQHESARVVRQWCITIATAAAFVEVSTTEQEAMLGNSQRATTHENGVA
jgi:hypothetical protein